MARDDPEIRPDSLRANDTMEVIIGVGEGEMEGPKDGARTLYVGDTAIENVDGTFNYKDFQVTVHHGAGPGEKIQPVLGGLSSTENVGVMLGYEEPIVRTGTKRQIDFLELRFVLSRLIKQNEKGQFPTGLHLLIDIKPSSSTIWSSPFPDSKFIISGKTTSQYPKEVIIPVQRIDDTYDIRVNRVFPDPDDGERFCDASWESFQEVFGGEYEFPNTTVLHLIGQATSQLSGNLEFWGIWRGKKVLVPSNMDARERTFAGTWDGTFKREWTRDPVWHLYDLVMNDRYGLNAYDPIVLDKWDCYEASQWTSELVPDGQGGEHPRFSFDHVLSEPKLAKEMARYMAGMFGGVFFDDGNGTAALRVDKPANAVHMFTPENVVDGIFEYSFTDIANRYNDITVSFINPELNWEEDRRRVHDQANIDKFGRVPLDFVAVGATNEQQAIRAGRNKLITSLTERMMVSFRVNRIAHAIQPYEIALIGDPRLGFAITGRAITLNAARDKITLRDRVYLEVGVPYEISVQATDTLYPTSSKSAHRVVTVPVAATTPRGQVTEIQLATPLPADLPAYFTFAMHQPDLGGGGDGGGSVRRTPISMEPIDGTSVDEALEDASGARSVMEYDDGTVGVVQETTYKYGVSKPFRILRVTEVDGDPDLHEITAIEINRNKWDFIDNGDAQDVARPGTTLDTTMVQPPKDFSAALRPRLIDGENKLVLSMNWDPSPTSLVRWNIITASFNGDPPTELGRTPYNRFEMIDPTPGQYVFSLASENYLGRVSTPVRFELDISGTQGGAVNPVVNLRSLDSDDDKFEGAALQVIWDPPTGTQVAGYLVEVWLDDGNGNYDKKRESFVDTNRYNYAASYNRSDFGQPSRRIGISVYSVDTGLNYSLETYRVFTNAAPETVGGVRVVGSPGRAALQWNPVPDDKVGYRVWGSTAGPQFVPGPGNLITTTSSSATAATITRPAGDWWFRVAAYDGFDDGLQDLQEIAAENLVRVRMRFVAAKPANYDRAVAELRAALALAGLTLDIVDEVAVNLPAHLTVVTEALLATPSTQQQTLHDAAKGASAQANDIVVCFVTTIQNSAVPPATFRGVGTTGIPSALVAASATDYTLAHEVCHCLGLTHVASTDNLMTSNTGAITAPPPDLDNAQEAVMQASPRVFPGWPAVMAQIAQGGGDSGAQVRLVNAPARVTALTAGEFAISYEIERFDDISDDCTVNWAMTSSLPANRFRAGQPFTGQAQFAVGQTSAFVSVVLTAQPRGETDKSVTLTLSSPVDCDLASPSAATTVVEMPDALSTPLVRLRTPPANAAASGTAQVNIDYVVERYNALTTAVTVPWTASSSLATSRYSGWAGSGTVSFAIGETTKTVRFTLNAQPLGEPAKNLVFALGTPTGASLGTPTSVTTAISMPAAIAAPQVRLSSVPTSVNAQAGANTAINCVIQRTGDTTGSSTVNWAFTSPLAANKFITGTVFSGTSSFAAGETSKTVSIMLAWQTRGAADSQVTLTLSGPTGATLGSPSAATTTVVMPDVQTQAIIALNAPPASVDLSANNQVTATYPVRRSNDTAGACSATWTLTKTAADAAFVNGTVFTGTVSFAAGETSKNVTFTFKSQSRGLPNKSMTLTLSAPVNAVLGTPAAGTTVIDMPDSITTPGPDRPDFFKRYFASDGTSAFSGRNWVVGCMSRGASSYGQYNGYMGCRPEYHGGNATGYGSTGSIAWLADTWGKVLGCAAADGSTTSTAASSVPSSRTQLSIDWLPQCKDWALKEDGIDHRVWFGWMFTMVPFGSRLSVCQAVADGDHDDKIQRCGERFRNKIDALGQDYKMVIGRPNWEGMNQDTALRIEHDGPGKPNFYLAGGTKQLYIDFTNRWIQKFWVGYGHRMPMAFSPAYETTVGSEYHYPYADYILNSNYDICCASFHPTTPRIGNAANTYKMVYEEDHAFGRYTTAQAIKVAKDNNRVFAALEHSSWNLADNNLASNLSNFDLAYQYFGEILNLPANKGIIAFTGSMTSQMTTEGYRAPTRVANGVTHTGWSETDGDHWTDMVRQHRKKMGHISKDV